MSPTSLKFHARSDSVGQREAARIPITIDAEDVTPADLGVLGELTLQRHALRIVVRDDLSRCLGAEERL